MAKNTSVIKVTLSDHFLVYADVVSKISFKPKEIQCRKLKGFSKNEFLSDLTVFTNNIDYNVDLVTLWNTFKANFISLCDKYAPLRTYRVKGNSQPWITDEIHICHQTKR